MMIMTNYIHPLILIGNALLFTTIFMFSALCYYLAVESFDDSE